MPVDIRFEVACRFVLLSWMNPKDFLLALNPYPKVICDGYQRIMREVAMFRVVSWFGRV